MSTTTAKARYWFSAGSLLTLRLIAGGALVIAGLMKIRDVSSLMLSMEAFELVPLALVPVFSYILPWLELIAGGLLIYGVWTRAAAGVAGGLYAVFTIGLMSVILRGMSVDCGCFGAITGGGDVGWGSIARNGVFLAASVGVMILGGGATALENIGRAAATETAEPLEGGDAARVTASPAGASS